jgi:serine/threonine-protein kinase
MSNDPVKSSEPPKASPEPPAVKKPWWVWALVGLVVVVAVVAVYSFAQPDKGATPKTEASKPASTGTEQPASQSPAAPANTDKVPDVTGKTAENAQQILGDAGFKPVLAEGASANVSSDSVIAQAPDAGTLVEPGSEVGILVSTGPLTGEPVLAPSVEGQPLAQAMAALKEQGFVGVPIPEQTELTVGDLVVRQVPAPAADMPQGGSVLLYHAQE